MKAFFFALASVLAGSAWANGGAYPLGVPSTGSGAGDVRVVGAPTPVRLEEERVVVRLQQEFADVDVVYLMRNVGSAREQLFYFPVRQWESAQAPIIHRKLPVRVERYVITVGDVRLKWADVNDDGQPLDAAPPGADRHAPRRVWKRSVLSFATGATLEVRISYRVPYARDVAFVSDATSAKPANCVYELSPAATWRDPIGKGEITVINEVPENEHVRIERPANRFQRVGADRWEWKFTELRPTAADDIRIITAPAEESVPHFERPNERGDYLVRGRQAWFSGRAQAAAVSSSLSPSGGKTYGPKNLTVGRGGVWAEGAEGDGIGESVTLTLVRPRPVDALLVWPGYYDYERSELWEKNNRLAECEVTLNGEHTFRAAIPNYCFQEAYPIPVRGYARPVKTVKLTILAVHRGSAYRDTCISGISLRTRLVKVPKLQYK